MPVYIFYALPFQFRNALRVKHQLFHFVIDTLVVRLNVDDGA